MSFLNDIKKLFSGKQSWLFLAVIIVLALGLAHYSSNKGLLGENMSSQRLLSQNDPNVTGEKLAAQQAGNVQPSAPLGGNGGFAQVSGVNSGVKSGMPSSCSPQSMPDPAALLPKDNNGAWAKLNPSGQGNLDSVSLLKAGYHIGIENSIFTEFSGCVNENLNTIDKSVLLQNLNSFFPNCKNVNFEIFGTSLATINFIISIALAIIIIKYFRDEKNVKN